MARATSRLRPGLQFASRDRVEHDRICGYDFYAVSLQLSEKLVRLLIAKLGIDRRNVKRGCAEARVRNRHLTFPLRIGEI